MLIPVIASILVLVVFSITFLSALSAPQNAFAGVSVETTIIPYLDTNYKFKVVSFGDLAGFELPAFDDSGFSIGNAGFGTQSGFCSLNNPVDAKTAWPLNTDILLRKNFDLPAGSTNLRVFVAIDNDIQVFVNGIDVSGGLIPHGGCPARDSFVFTAPDNILNEGENLLSVRAHDRGVLSYVDVRVVFDVTDLITVPNVIGFSQTEAKQIIIDAGLTAVEGVTYVIGDTFDQVVDQDPLVGIPVEPGFPVTLLVSLGPGIEISSNFDGDIKVKNESVIIHGVNVNGAISAMGGSIIIEEGSTVNGDVEVNCQIVIITGSTINGDVEAENCDSVNIKDSVIFGDLEIENVNEVDIENGSFANIELEANNSITVSGTFTDGDIEIEDCLSLIITGNTIAGDLEIEDCPGAVISDNIVTGETEIEAEEEEDDEEED